MPELPHITLFRAGHDLQDDFLNILSRIELHARISFRHYHCPHAKADAVAETVAMCWSWFVRLARRGRDATRFASRLASYAVLSVRAGRRLCGQESVRDTLSPVAQQRFGLRQHRLNSRRLPSV